MLRRIENFWKKSTGSSTSAVKDSKTVVFFGRLKIPTHLKEFPLWKKALALPSDPTWYAVINVLCVASVCCHIYYASAGTCVKLTTLKNSLFVADIFYSADIVLSLCAKYVLDLNRHRTDISTRPLWMLFFEVCSIIPIEMSSAYKEYQERTLYCVLKLNRCLRLIKVCYFFRRYYELIDNSINVRIIEMYMNILVIGLSTYMIYCNVHCFRDYCDDFCNFRLITSIFAKITISGVSQHQAYDIAWDFTVIMAMLVSFFLVCLLTTCHLIIENIESIYDKQRFILLHSYELETLKNFHLPPFIFQNLRTTHALNWEKCGGFNENMTFLRFIPPIMRREVLLNISWSAFYHSSLFRDQDVAYLRHLAAIVRQRFYMPGEYIFKKNEIKKKMVYVVSGTVQLLSEDDGESPIMSFCNGTCIGESSLFISYKSKNHVYCKNICEVHILERKDFVKMCVQYPALYHHFRAIINRRYEESKYDKTLADYAKSLISQTQRTKDTCTIIWMKNTLHRLMSTDKESTARHEIQNIYLLYDIDTRIFEQMLFCANYLDLLAIQERREAEKDTVFVKTSFPCILQTNSIVLYINELFIIVMTLVASYLLPHMSFVLDNVPPHYYTIINTITFFNWIDIYIQLSTGIHTRHGMISKVKAISALKMRDLCFWCDIVSCVPLEIFSTVFIEVVNDQNKARLRLNRLTKLYRVFRLFQRWETKLNFNLVLIRYLKFAWIHAYTTFFVSRIVILLYPELDMTSVVFVAVQIATAVGLIQSTFDSSALIFFIMDIAFFFIRLIMCTQIVSAYIMTTMHELQAKIRCSEILNKFKTHKVSEKYSQRARMFFSVQNLYKLLQDEHFYVAEKPKFIQDDITEYLLSDILQSHVFFQILPHDCLRDICSKMKTLILPSNEVIIYAGDICSKVYVVWMGKYTTYDASGQHVRLTSGDRVINVLPAVFKASAALSYVTVTDCRLVSFDIGEFWQVLVRYPTRLHIFNSVMASCGDIAERMVGFAEIEADTDITRLLKVKEKSFYYFGFQQKEDSFEEFDYFVPFDHLYPFGFIKIFLMRLTIMPDGTFIKAWEAARCVFAVLTALLIFTHPIHSTHITYVISFLDFTAFADLYVRFHICYYNDEGILVKHPLKTAAHYLTNGFLIDFFATFPFKYLSLTDYKDAVAFFISHGNCLLQLHRYVQFFRVMRNKSIAAPNHAYAMIFLPILLVAVNFLGSLLIKSECVFNSDLVSESFTGGLYCAPDSVLANSPFQKPIGPWRAHVYGMYIFAGLLTTSGWQGYNIINNTSKIIVTVSSYIGLYSTILLSAYIISFYAMRYGSMLAYQDQMRFLKIFMKQIGVRRRLRKFTINNCAKYWSFCQGQPLTEIVQPLHVTLRLDVLYDCFGKKAYIYSIFEYKNKNFYRNILQHGKTYYVLKNDYVLSINELISYTMILLDGVVEVIGADGVQLTSLYPGSLFGNLDNQRYVRVRQTLIAGTHLELFLIESKRFYEVISHYPKMEKEFYAMKAANISYIRSTARYNYVHEAAISAKVTSTSFFDRVFDPNSKAIQTWKMFILVFTCYLGIMVDFYQLGAGDFSYYILALQYSSDILYGINYLLRDRIAYEDERGTMVMDRDKIRKKNKEQRMMNIMSLISLIPLDAFVIVYPFPPNVKSLIFGCFRLNRLLRIIYVFDLFYDLVHRLNVNVLAVRAFYILVWVSLYLTGKAALIGIFSCSFQLNMYPKTPKCTDLHSIGNLNRTSLYIRFLYMTTNSLMLSTQHHLYPEGAPIIVLFSVLMAVGHHLHGICLGQMFETVFGRYLPKYLYRSVLRRLRFFINAEDLSPSLHTRVEYYMSTLWHIHGAILDPSLLSNRPAYLNDAVLNDAFYYKMRKHPLFKDCHADCLRQIVQKFKFRPYFTGGYIQLEKAIDETMYMLIYGKVAVIADVSTNVNEFLHVMDPTSFFGVLAGFYPRRPHTYTYRSIHPNSFVVYLKRKDWIHILNFFPASKELVYEAARNYKGY